MKSKRRKFLKHAGLSSLAAVTIGCSEAEKKAEPYSQEPKDENRKINQNPIGVSTYSFWQFDGPKENARIESCIDKAAGMGFDGIEILHVQMISEENEYLQRLKKRAFHAGMDICGFSTHQGFLRPDKSYRKENIEKTLKQIELAYRLGIPTMRINTGRWGTIESFDELMANKGIEPRIEGYTDEDGFMWVIDSIEKCIPKAEECGVVLGLENHWGLGRTAEGVRRIVEEIDSPWLMVTLDTGNFLENTYEQLKLLASKTILLQAKTYFGGGKWYTLDLNYDRIGEIMRLHDYRGYVSLEFEGATDPDEAIPKSLKKLREVFYYEV